MKLLIVLGLVALTFATKNKTSSARSDDIDLIDQSEDNSADNLQKRESGYLYPRPRPSFPTRRIKGIKNKRPSRIVRPFMTYGPPKSPVNSASKNKYQNINSNRPKPQFQAPDPLKIVEFTKPNAIASQNEEPFRPSSANYLPPKNQKLPTHPATYFQQSSQSFQPQKFQNPPVSSQISDAAQFLQQNAPAISQLYRMPAINQNYEPLPEQNPTISSRSHQSEALPSYASGTLEPYRSLQQVQSLEKDQLIAELRQQLAVQDSQRYAAEHGSFLSNFDTQNKGLIGQSVYGPPAPAPDPTPADQPALGTQHTNQGNSFPTSLGAPGLFPFPQYAEGLSPVIGGTNFLMTGTSLPTFFGSNAPGLIDSPTHFSLPIPSNNKPLTPANTKPSFPSLHPVSGGHYPVVHPHPHPQLQPLPHPHPHPQLQPHPIQPIHPHPVQPVLGVHPVPVSPVILKPVKQVIPVYYPSVPYVIQKPSLPAPSYSVIKSAQIW